MGNKYTDLLVCKQFSVDMFSSDGAKINFVQNKY
jgi:hypothetical protein